MSQSTPVTKIITVLAAAARTTDTGATFTCPAGCDYLDIVMWSTTTPSGTSPTMDLAIQTSFDNGTTWIAQTRSTQVTTLATGRRVLHLRTPARNELLGDRELQHLNTGGLKVHDFVSGDNIVRVLQTIGGTSPSFSTGIHAMMRTNK